MIVRALESDDASIPAHYTGYAETSIAVSDSTGNGGSATGAMLALGTVAEAHVSASVVRPAALATAPLLPSTSLEFADARLFLSDDETTTTQDTAFDFVFPVVSGSTARIWFSTVLPGIGDAVSSEEVEVVLLPSSSVQLDLPAPVDLLEPADAAVIGPSTVFRWSGGPTGGVRALRVLCEFDAGTVNYRQVETTGTEVSIPSIPGLTIPSGAACSWDVSWTSGPADSSRRYSKSVSRSAIFQ